MTHDITYAYYVTIIILACSFKHSCPDRYALHININIYFLRYTLMSVCTYTHNKWKHMIYSFLDKTNDLIKVLKVPTVIENNNKK